MKKTTTTKKPTNTVKKPVTSKETPTSVIKDINRMFDTFGKW